MAKTTAEKKTQLNLSDRIHLPSVLKTEGSYMYLTVRKDIIEKLALTQEEFKKYEIKEVQEGIQKGWLVSNQKKVPSHFDISFTELEKNEIKLALEKLDKDEKLPEYLQDAFEKFCK